MSELDKDALEGLALLVIYAALTWLLALALPWWLALILAWPALVLIATVLPRGPRS